MDLFNDVNMKQFELVKHIIDNENDDHVKAKLVCFLRCDRYDVPYYMDTQILLTYCSDIHDKGIIHAMDIFNHHRMYNLTEDKYNELNTKFKEYISEEDNNKQIKVSIEDKKSSLHIETLTTDELQDIFTKYGEFFKIIDELA